MIPQTHQSTPNYTPVAPGDLLLLWCSACMDRTYHRYEPAGLVKLVCTEHEKEKSEVTK